MFDRGPNFVPACKMLALVWVPAALLWGVHTRWPLEGATHELSPKAMRNIRAGTVPPLVAQCETGLVAAHKAGEISAAARDATLPECYQLALKHNDGTAIVVAALKVATLANHDDDGGWTAKHLPPTPSSPRSPPPPPLAPDCTTTMRHAQLEYVRNRFCEFGPSFTLEKTATASPADLVIAAYTSAMAANGPGTGACRMLAVGSDPSVRATATFMATAGEALKCDVRLYETEVNSVANHINSGGSTSYTHMGLLMGKKQGTTLVSLGTVEKKTEGKFTAQQRQGLMEVKTVTPEKEMCADASNPRGYCTKHHVDLVHLTGGAGGAFDVITKGAKTFLDNKKIRALVFDGTAAQATTLEKHGYVVYLVGAPSKGGGLPVMIRVDTKWAHTHYGQYSGGTKGNGDAMLKTYFAVAPDHVFHTAAVVGGMMACDGDCACVPPTTCECGSSLGSTGTCVARVH